MPIGPTFSGSLLKLVFQGNTIATIADNSAGISTAASTALWCALHTAQPSSDAQTGNEAAYGGYARTSIARTTAGTAFSFTAASSAGVTSKLNPSAVIAFPAATSGSETETFFSIGKSSVGTGQIYWSGSLSPTIAVSAGVTPRLTTGSTIVLS